MHHFVEKWCYTPMAINGTDPKTTETAANPALTVKETPKRGPPIKITTPPIIGGM